MKSEIFATVLAASLGMHGWAQSSALPSAPLQLADVVRVAVEASAEKQGAEFTIQAMQARIKPATALPDPSISGGWAGKLAPMATMAGDPSSYRGITISESFPYPGKRQLQKQIAERDVETAKADCNAVVRKVELDARLAFAEYLYTQQALEISIENKDLLVKLAASAEAQYRAGKATQRDVLRAQTETTLALKAIEELKAAHEESRIELTRLLHQPEDQELGKAEIPDQSSLLYSQDELLAKAIIASPDVVKSASIIAKNKASEDLAMRQSRPDIGLSYSYQQRTGQADMNGLTVTVSLPVSWKTKQREAIREASETLHASQAMKTEAELRTRTEIRKEWAAIESADKTLRLIHEAIVPQSNLTFESALSAYQNGKLEFQSLLADLTTLLDVRMTETRVQANRQESVARIESMTGDVITRNATKTNEAAQ